MAKILYKVFVPGCSVSSLPGHALLLSVSPERESHCSGLFETLQVQSLLQEDVAPNLHLQHTQSEEY